MNQLTVSSWTEYPWGGFLPCIHHDEGYTYNANSMRTNVDYYYENCYSDDGCECVHHNTYDGGDRLFSYDALLRLTSEHRRSAAGSSNWRRGYSYDAAGNRTQMVNYNGTTTATTNYTYNDFNQLTTNGTTHTYDDNGNLYTAGGQSYTHNRENRLVAHEGPSIDFTEYVYDYLGRRIQRHGPTGIGTKYYYDGINVLLTKEDPVGTTSWRTKQVYMLKQSDIGQIAMERTNTAWDTYGNVIATDDKYYFHDIVGNVIAHGYDGANWITPFEQEAFGNVTLGSQSGYHLTTKEYDSDSGLYYFNARWYNPAIGRWLQHEPLRWDGPNLYHFTFNNPIDRIDVDGLLTLHVREDSRWGHEFVLYRDPQGNWTRYELNNPGDGCSGSCNGGGPTHYPVKYDEALQFCMNAKFVKNKHFSPKKEKDMLEWFKNREKNRDYPYQFPVQQCRTYCTDAFENRDMNWWEHVPNS